MAVVLKFGSRPQVAVAVEPEVPRKDLCANCVHEVARTSIMVANFSVPSVDCGKFALPKHQQNECPKFRDKSAPAPTGTTKKKVALKKAANKKKKN